MRVGCVRGRGQGSESVRGRGQGSESRRPQPATVAEGDQGPSLGLDVVSAVLVVCVLVRITAVLVVCVLVRVTAVLVVCVLVRVTAVLVVCDLVRITAVWVGCLSTASTLQTHPGLGPCRDPWVT